MSNESPQPPAKEVNKLAIMAALTKARVAVTNAVIDRTAWLRRLMDPMRDIDQECGHPQTIQLTEYVKAWDRGDVAGRVVTVWPEESWSENPFIFETEDEEETAFEVTWNELEERHRILSMLQRADTLSGIGRFGIILLGIGDGKPLSEPCAGLDEAGEPIKPAAPTPPTTNLTIVREDDDEEPDAEPVPPAPFVPKNKLLYLRVFDENAVKIKALQNDVTNPRYGQPVSYSIQFQDGEGLGSTTPQGQPSATSTLEVHWTRVIHVADNRMTSEIFGVPRMQKVYNRILDIKKIAGGSAEMFWKGGFPGLSLEALPSDVPTEIDYDTVKAQMDAYQNSLQRYIALDGMQAKSLAPQVADPASHIENQIRLISMTLGVPWRVFVGSEAAQLASEQDTRAWNRRLKRRRDEYVTPYLILPVINRLIGFGILPAPENIIVQWPDLNTLSDKEKAEVAKSQTEALAKYSMGGVDLLMPPFHFLTLILGLDDEKARSILEEAEERMAEAEEQMEAEAEAAAAETEKLARIAAQGNGGNKPPNGRGNGSAAPPPAQRSRPPVRPTMPLRP